MIITFGGVKGGVGKTTLAVNVAIGLALQGQDCLLIDGDEQGTAAAFTETRVANHPSRKQYTAVRLLEGAIRTQVRTQLGKRYPQIVIDVGGRNSGSLRAALLVSDLVLIPAAPRSFDMWGIDDTMQLVGEAREMHPLRAMAVLNGADPAGNRNQEALELLAGIDGLEVFPHPIVRRTAYSSAADEGLSVLEYMDNNNRPGCLKARLDFTRLLEGIYAPLAWRLTA